MTEPLSQTLQPTYAGDQTFLRAPRTSLEELGDDADVAVVGVPFDGAVTRQPGTRYGPRAVREASAWYGGFDRETSAAMYEADTGRVVDLGDMTVRDVGDVTVYPSDAERTGERLRAAVEHLATRAFPVVLGGDHYVTYPAFVGFAEAVEGEVGLVHLDSHSDLYGPGELVGEHNHGGQMDLLHASGHGGMEHHAMVGIRGRQPADLPDLIGEDGLSVATARDVHDHGIEACMQAAFEHAGAGVDHLYLTVDIDVVDPGVAPGTGTPEQGGLGAVDLLRAMELAAEHEQIGAMDLVEVAPRLDPTRNTQRLGAAAVVRFLEERFC